MKKTDTAYFQRKEIEDYKTRIDQLNSIINGMNKLYNDELYKCYSMQSEIYNLKQENKCLLRANYNLVNKENSYYQNKLKQFKSQIKELEQKLKEKNDENIH